MATGGGDVTVTNQMMVQLAESISAKHLECIALKYMDIEPETHGESTGFSIERMSSHSAEMLYVNGVTCIADLTRER